MKDFSQETGGEVKDKWPCTQLGKVPGEVPPGTRWARIGAT